MSGPFADGCGCFSDGDLVLHWLLVVVGFASMAAQPQPTHGTLTCILLPSFDRLSMMIRASQPMQHISKVCVQLLIHSVRVL